MSDTLLQKKASIARCIQQAQKYYAVSSEEPFADDHLKRDAIVVNLQRACEQCIDLANHAIRLRKLGLPANSAECFTLLRKAKVIDAGLEKRLIGMVGFRNVIVHEYQDIDYKLVEQVVNTHSNDLLEFADILTTPSK